MRFAGRARGVAFAAACVVFAGIAGPASAEPPAIVAVTLDTSGSIRPEILAATRDLALSVLEALPPGSEIALFTFDDESRLVLPRSHDPEAIRQALAGVNRAGRYTALHDAIYDASRYLAEAPPSRKAIVLITDGLDENSALKLEDGMKIAVENRIPVFAVGVGNVQEAVLRRIAKLSAGEFTKLEDTSGSAIAGRIAELPMPTPPPPAAPAPVVQPLPAAGRPAAGRTALWLGSLALLVLGAATVIYLRRRPGQGALPPAGSEDEEEEGEEGAKDDATVVMRSPTVTPVEKTVMLRFNPGLKVTAGPLQGQVFRLSSETALSIGRAPTNDVAIPDTAVSSEHCRVRPEGGVFVVHDLKSTNGTFVNDKRIKRHALMEGDVIRVGETRIEFRMDQS